MGLTLWCILVVWASPLLLGVPLQWLLNRGRPLDESAWLQAPFLGLGAIVLVTQNLAYLGCPVATSAGVLWAVALLGWLILVKKRGLGWAGVPALVFAAALAVYLFHGMGLLALGARVYTGQGWWDQWQYVGLAQFFKDCPYGTTLDRIGHQAALAWPIVLKVDRIGQSLLHAFFAASSFQDAKTLFEPTILLLPALTVLAAYALARRLGVGRWAALAAAVVAGLLPGIAALHLECFLSQALAVPLLLLIPVLLDDLHRRPGWASLLRAAILLATLISTYTELMTIAAGGLVLGLAIMASRRPVPWRLFGWYGGVACTTLLLNPGFLPLMRPIVLRAAAAGTSAGTYPWSLSLEGWGRLWLGDLAAPASDNWQSVARFTAVALTALAYLGLWRGWRRSWEAARADRGGIEGRRSLALFSLVAGFSLLPVLVTLKDGQHPYQFYKLLLTFGPLLAIGLALWRQVSGENLPIEARSASEGDPLAGASGFNRPLAGASGFNRPLAGASGFNRNRQVFARNLSPRAIFASLPLGLALAAAAAATGRMVLGTANDEPAPRSFTHILHSEAVRHLQDQLRVVPAGDLVLAQHHPFLDSWMAYLGRKHRLWLFEPDFLHPWTIEGLRRQGVLDTASLPVPVMVLTTNPSAFLAVSPGEIDLAWSCPFLRFWVARSRGWALPVVFTAPHGAGSLAGRTFLRLGSQPTCIEMLAGGSGSLTVRGDFVPGPGTPAGSCCRVCVGTSAGEKADLVTAGGPGAVTVPLPAGKSVVTLRSGTPGEPGPGVGGLTLEFVPGSSVDGGGRTCW